MRRWNWKIALLMLVVLAWSTGAFAQNRGTITGRVTDESGAVVPGVSIKVGNVNTGVARDTLTNETGVYSVELLPVGEYRVEAELTGFKKEVRSGLNLTVDQVARIDFTLKVGAASEVVEVTGSTPLVQTDNSSLGAVIEDRKVVDLPLNGRDFSALTYLVPGAFVPSQGSALGYRGGFTTGGVAEDANQFILDGINNNGTGTMEIGARVNIDALQEFKIETSTYSAQLGRFGGAQVTAVTKSGTNQVHGTGFFFTRNSAIDARNVFDDPPCDEFGSITPRPRCIDKLPPFKRHQYGGTMGGPIAKNKTFFFASYQGQRQQKLNTRQATVPLPQFFTGDLSARPVQIKDPLTGVNFTNNQIPANRIWSGAKALSQFWPAPTQTLSSGVGLVTSLLPEPDNFNQFSVRVDHQLTPKNSLSVVHNYYFEKLIEYAIAGNPQIPGFATASQLKPQSTSFGLVTMINNTTVNELRLGETRIKRSRFQEVSDRDFNQTLGITGVTADFLGIAKGVPRFTITGFEPIGDATNMPQPRVDQTYSFVETISFQKGLHSIKAGFDYYLQQMNLILVTNGRGTFAFQGNTISGDPMADFILGYPFQSSRNLTLAQPDAHPRRTSVDGFLQDDWKIRPNLTLNLGVRYEVDGILHEKYNKMGDFDRTTASFRVVSKDNPLHHVDKNNIAPRIGFAWRPLHTNALVIRGGYGVFYTIDDLCACNFYSSNAPFYRSETYQATANLISMTNPFPAALSRAGAVTGAGYDPYYKTGQYQHWNLGVERELPGKLAVSLSYEGKKGTHLQRDGTMNINQPATPLAVANAALRDSLRPFPAFGNISWSDAGGDSIYHAGQTKVEKRFSGGLSFIFGYTFSKAIDDLASYQNNYDQRQSRGLSNADNRHRLQYSYVYDLPFGPGSRYASNLTGPLGKIVGGWEISGIYVARSGQPFTPSWSGDIANIGATSVRPNIVGDWRIDNPTAAQWWNSAAFVAPAAGTFGNAGRNILTGPTYWNTDLSLMKNTKFMENRNLQLRFEFFNAMNHPNFDPPNNVVNSGTFGRVTTANQNLQNARQIQLGAKIQF